MKTTKKRKRKYSEKMWIVVEEVDGKMFPYSLNRKKSDAAYFKNGKDRLIRVKVEEI